MKLLIQSAMVTVVVLGLALGAFGFQRIANWGGPSAAQGKQRGGVSWSRGGANDTIRRWVRRGIWARLGSDLEPGLSEGGPAVSGCAEPADADQRAVDRAGGGAG